MVVAVARCGVSDAGSSVFAVPLMQGGTTIDSDVAIAIYAAIGVIYAVMLALIVVEAWSDHEDARAAAFREATALTNLMRLAQGVDAATRSALLRETCHYAAIVRGEEWPVLEHGWLPGERRVQMMRLHCRSETFRIPGDQALDQLYLILAADPAPGARGDAFVAAMIDELNELGDARAARLDAACSHLPRIMWGILWFGLLLIVLFTAHLEGLDAEAHPPRVLALGVFVVLLLYSVWIWDHPFGSLVPIAPSDFDRALRRCEAPAGQPLGPD
jgi:hypothetical protein